MVRVVFGVLGPTVAAVDSGDPLALKGPRHRAVLARLIVARRRVVPVARLVEDLWADPPPGAVGAVQTFVAALRRVLEPERPPRAPARLLVTDGPGYALRTDPDTVDAWRFETALSTAAGLPAPGALATLEEALGWWRGPAYAEFADEDWSRGERARLAELRLQAVERRAEAHLALGRPADAVPDLDAHLTDHPWREDAWRLLALALYRQHRQGDALAVLRRAREVLVNQLGLDPGQALRHLESDILTQAPALDLRPGGAPQHDPAQPHPPRGAGNCATSPHAPAPNTQPTTTADLWTRAAKAYDRTVAEGSRVRLESTVGLIRNLAVTGGEGLAEARHHRTAAITAAEEFADPELTARVIGAYDVPAIWTRADDPAAAQHIVAVAERTLTALPTGPHDTARCRLLATVALEIRGATGPRGPEAAREAEALARRLDDPALLAFALNGTFMQSFTRAGLAPRRDAIGAELVELAARHGLVTYEVLGRLIRLQARAALADFAAADTHAAAADRLAERHELPLVGVFTDWYGALRLSATGEPARAETACRAAAARLDGAGMPGLERGLLPLALLCLRLTHGLPPDPDPRADWGPHRPWAEPFTLIAEGRHTEARTALRALPEPPHDLLYEAYCALEAEAALRLDDRTVLERARTRLRPAAAELAGAGSGLLTLGPVERYLAD
ncbi:DNA-binding SARP family transcriptional activator [Streptomyces umbrinus]|uniref:DNA-binding SARP family transcriptional activator n=1 Tax=Streptomyces umbrinus TaxID=67370 RepID=A0ABU0SWI6_9ACTN|nr:BTAD domain-containing putative transcriptional regulator [Streptomyces umbrinus]MDQ1027913.1 DNA-binding SARP family transcriptional activator [Streptomyces umbrinus]